MKYVIFSQIQFYFYQIVFSINFLDSILMVSLILIIKLISSLLNIYI